MIMTTTADRDTLIATLMANGERTGNYRLMEQLGWDAARYNPVRDGLISEGVLSQGRGRGGTVYFADADAAAPVAKVAKEPKAVKLPKTAKVVLNPEETINAAALALDTALATL
jgi:hypothetical protein